MKQIRKFLDTKGRYVYLGTAIISALIGDFTIASLLLSIFFLEITTKKDIG